MATVLQTLTDVAPEEGTYVITAAFTDEEGSSVVPNSLTWTLTDHKGNVINGKEDVSVPTPTASETFVLEGDDLAIAEDEEKQELVKRLFHIEGDYDSSNGNGLPLKGACEFDIENLQIV